MILQVLRALCETYSYKGQHWSDQTDINPLLYNGCLMFGPLRIQL